MDAFHAQVALLRSWTEPHRFYHTLPNHLLPMLETIDMDAQNPFDRNLLAQMAWWHDVVCIAGAKDNEEQSVLLMREHVPHIHPRVEHAIMATVHHMPTGDTLVDYFLRLDLAPLAHGTIAVLQKNEALLREEYAKFGEQEYCAGRVDFLTGMLNHPLVPETNNIRWLIDHIQSRLERVMHADIEARR